MSALPEHSHSNTQPKLHSAWLFFLMVYDLKPLIVELTAQRWVGGLSQKARATLARKKKKKSHNTNQLLASNREAVPFPKTDYLHSLQCSLSYFLSEASCSLGSRFDIVDPSLQEESRFSAPACVHARQEEERSLIHKLSMQTSKKPCQVVFFFFYYLVKAMGCWNWAR